VSRQLALLLPQRDPALWQRLLSRFGAWWLAGGAGDGAPAKGAERRAGKTREQPRRIERWRWDGKRWQSEILAGE
jgi:hypothetical protein